MSGFQVISNVRWINLILLPFILSLYGCNDVSEAPVPPPPLSPDAFLSKLTVSPGTLQPTFSSSVASYSVSVDFNVSSVTVTATPQNASATMTINGQATPSNQARTVTLGGVGSSTSIPIVVTAVNGSQNTYIVTVQRAVNNSLQSLTVSPGTLAPTFDPNETHYTVDVGSNVTDVNVTATLQDTTATMTINAQATNSGQTRTITLGPAGTNTLVTIVVTAQNGGQKTYVVTVIRQALGGNNNLSALSVTGQTLSPAFTAATLNYTVAVASNVTSVNVSATKSDPNAVMSGSVTAGAGQATGQATVALGGAPSSTPVSILVTAPNGSQKTYTVTVNRAAPANSNNNLSSLAVSAGPLNPSFVQSTTGYTVTVPTTTLNTTVTAIVADSTATLTINGAAATSGVPMGPIALAIGANPIQIQVTAQDGTPKIYTVTVNREAPVSGNSNLSALVVAAGGLVPTFNAATTSYDVAANGALATTVTATVEDSTAGLTINGLPAVSGLPFPIVIPGSTSITIVVTAQDLTQKTYTVNITP